VSDLLRWREVCTTPGYQVRLVAKPEDAGWFVVVRAHQRPDEWLCVATTTVELQQLSIAVRRDALDRLAALFGVSWDALEEDLLGVAVQHGFFLAKLDEPALFDALVAKSIEEIEQARIAVEGLDEFEVLRVVFAGDSFASARAAVN
jgi:hypothetical protein